MVFGGVDEDEEVLVSLVFFSFFLFLRACSEGESLRVVVRMRKCDILRDRRVIGGRVDGRERRYKSR